MGKGIYVSYSWAESVLVVCIMSLYWFSIYVKFMVSGFLLLCNRIIELSRQYCSTIVAMY